MKLILIPTMIAGLAGCAAEPVRESVSVRLGNVSCTERLADFQGAEGRASATAGGLGSNGAGLVGLAIPTTLPKGTDGPVRRCAKLLSQAEDLAQASLAKERALASRAAADARLAHAKADAEIEYMQSENQDLEAAW